MKLTLKAVKEGAVPFSFFAFKSPDKFAARCIMDASNPINKYIEWIHDTNMKDKGEYHTLLVDWLCTVKHLGYEPKLCELAL